LPLINKDDDDTQILNETMPLNFTGRHLYLALVFFALMLSTAYAAGNKDSLVERGDKFFNIRGEHHLLDRAVTANISNAIDAYLEAYDIGNPDEELIIKIMRASHYYVTYAETDIKLQKKIITKAMEIGEKGLAAYSDSAGINYWMAALWGRWSKIYGHIASSRKDVAARIKVLAERTIELDPLYAEGGGYRTLGRLHFKTPRIPFLISWPRKKKALEYLKKAVEAGPDNLTNHLFYAEALMKSDYKEEAKKEVGFILKVKTDEQRVVEELRVKREAGELQAKLNDNVDVMFQRKLRVK